MPGPLISYIVQVDRQEAQQLEAKCVEAGYMSVAAASFLKQMDVRSITYCSRPPVFLPLSACHSVHTAVLALIITQASVRHAGDPVIELWACCHPADALPYTACLL